MNEDLETKLQILSDSRRSFQTTKSQYFVVFIASSNEYSSAAWLIDWQLQTFSVLFISTISKSRKRVETIFYIFSADLLTWYSVAQILWLISFMSLVFFCEVRQDLSQMSNQIDWETCHRAWWNERSIKLERSLKNFVSRFLAAVWTDSSASYAVSLVSNCIIIIITQMQ